MLSSTVVAELMGWVGLEPTSPTIVPTVILIPRIDGLPPMIIGLRVILSSSGNCMALDVSPGIKKTKLCWEAAAQSNDEKATRMISRNCRSLSVGRQKTVENNGDALIL